MILVDTSVIVAWLDASHPEHLRCVEALARHAEQNQLAISSVTYAELAAGGRTREAIDEDLNLFEKLDLGFDAAYRAGVAFGRYHPGKQERRPVLPDFLIRAQAAILGMPHLTNDRRRTGVFPEVDFIFP
jgi:predicted nucleic acid-binding protein